MIIKCFIKFLENIIIVKLLCKTYYMFVIIILTTEWKYLFLYM